MARELKPIDPSIAPEVLRLIEEVRRTNESRIVRWNGEDVVTINPVAPPRGDRLDALEAAIWRDVGVDEPGAIWKDYDPAKVRQALGQSAGALVGTDTKRLIKDLEEVREQDTPGRPA